MDRLHWTTENLLPSVVLLPKRSPTRLSQIEVQAIERIRAMRSTPDDELHGLLQDPAQAMHHLILVFHGNVKLRAAAIAKELGAEMRTLERAFHQTFGKSMSDCQVEARLLHAQYMLSMMPPLKMSVIAHVLGYDEIRDFARFFQKQMHQTPSEWGRREREMIKRSERLAAGMRESS